MIKNYRKKPVVIKAVQWTGDNLDEVQNFLEKDFSSIDAEKWMHDRKDIVIKTLEGLMVTSVNDFIIEGVNGNFYPCKPEIFHKTYELA